MSMKKLVDKKQLLVILGILVILNGCIQTPDYKLFRKGVKFYHKKMYDDAIMEFSKAIQLNPKFAKAYYDRGLTYYTKGLYDNAISDYSKAIELESRLEVAYFNRGVVYYKKGDYDNAIVDYSNVLKINPRKWDAYFNRGLAYAEKGLNEQAINDFKKMIEVKPKDTDALLNLSFALYASGRYREALETLQRVIKIFRAKGDYDSARRFEELEKILRQIIQLEESKGEKEKTERRVKLEVQGIMYDKVSPTAIVNEKIVKKGDEIDGCEVADITADYVKFKCGSQIFDKKIEFTESEKQKVPHTYKYYTGATENDIRTAKEFYELNEKLGVEAVEVGGHLMVLNINRNLADNLLSRRLDAKVWLKSAADFLRSRFGEGAVIITVYYQGIRIVKLETSWTGEEIITFSQ